MVATRREDHRAAMLGLALAIGLILAPGSASALSCIRYVQQRLGISIERVVRVKDNAPAPADVRVLVSFERMIASRIRIKLKEQLFAVLAFHSGPKPGQRRTSSKWFVLYKALPPTPVLGRRLAGLAGRRWEVICGFSVPFLPLMPGSYAFSFDNGDSRLTTPRDIASAVLRLGRGLQRAELEFSYRGVRYRAHYKVFADMTQFPGPITPQLRLRGMCLRGFRRFCH